MISEESIANLANLARDMRAILLELREVTRYMKEAESEVPEKMRRFIMYMHDLHDVVYMYEERGLPVPVHILREMERCDDRFRQLMAEQNAEGGAIARVRAEMAADPANRWDHTRQLAAPTLPKEKA